MPPARKQLCINRLESHNSFCFSSTRTFVFYILLLYKWKPCRTLKLCLSALFLFTLPNDLPKVQDCHRMTKFYWLLLRHERCFKMNTPPGEVLCYFQVPRDKFLAWQCWQINTANFGVWKMSLSCQEYQHLITICFLRFPLVLPFACLLRTSPLGMNEEREGKDTFR